MMDNLFIELDQDTGVPQILTRVDTRHLPSGVIRVDLRQHYANHLRTRNPVRVDQAFRVSPFLVSRRMQSTSPERTMGEKSRKNFVCLEVKHPEIGRKAK